MKQPDDAALGMNRPISRRDLLDGARVALSGSLAYSWFTPTGAAQSVPSSAYPPALTGMRGTHDGAWEVAHAVRDGRTWDDASSTDTGETYDLVVVGGGMAASCCPFTPHVRRDHAKDILKRTGADDIAAAGEETVSATAHVRGDRRPM